MSVLPPDPSPLHLPASVTFRTGNTFTSTSYRSSSPDNHSKELSPFFVDEVVDTSHKSSSAMPAFLAPPQPHAGPYPSRPALPRRLLSLQHTSTIASAPTTPTNASPSYPSRPGLSPMGLNAGGGKRPGAPRRAHSFCGDSSASTYALASANACAHLSSDKEVLVAPPLERTLSSMGSKGNQSPPSQQMKRPNLVDGVMAPPTPPSSPPTDNGPKLPQIKILPTSPARSDSTITPARTPVRPALSPWQPRLSYTPQASPAVEQNDPYFNQLGHTPGEGIAPRPKRPSLASYRSLSGSSAYTLTSSSSRSSSYSIGTPMTPNVMPIGVIHEEAFKKSRGDEGDDDDLMIVDGMTERVEELSMAA